VSAEKIRANLVAKKVMHLNHAAKQEVPLAKQENLVITGRTRHRRRFPEHLRHFPAVCAPRSGPVSGVALQAQAACMRETKPRRRKLSASIVVFKPHSIARQCSSHQQEGRGKVCCLPEVRFRTVDTASLGHVMQSFCGDWREFAHIRHQPSVTASICDDMTNVVLR
jgi:hypothetical protein